MTNCSNNYGPYQFPEKLIPLFINNIRKCRPLPVYGRGENVRDWLYVEDHARAIDVIFHRGRAGETYNIGGFNEWRNIDIVRLLIRTVDRMLGRPEGASDGLITYVADRKGHDLRYAMTRGSCSANWAGSPRCSSRRGSSARCAGTSRTASGWTASPRGPMPTITRRCMEHDDTLPASVWCVAGCW